MAYPKPLNEKTLEKKYRDVGLTPVKISFIRTFFEACVNLYGSIQVSDAWGVYKELANKSSCEKLQRKDMLNAAAIMRREPNNFQVYEAEELYSDYKNSDLHREIVHPDLIGRGYNKNFYFVELKNNTEDIGYYIPEDFLKYAQPQHSITKQEASLRAFVGNLAVNMDEYEDPYLHTRRKCSGHKGERLKDFSWMNREETLNLQFAKGELTGKKCDLKEVEFLTKLYSRTEAEKIADNLRKWNHIGFYDRADIMKYTFWELAEVGVALSEKQVREFIRLIIEMHNNQHLWLLNGRSPALL